MLRLTASLLSSTKWCWRCSTIGDEAVRQADVLCDAYDVRTALLCKFSHSIVDGLQGRLDWL